jgi:TPR repeat protein
MKEPRLTLSAHMFVSIVGAMSLCACARGFVHGPSEAQSEFMRDASCPAERVDVREAARTAPEPPADIRADPERLALWSRKEGDEDARFRSYDVKGCGRSEVYRCRQTNKGMSGVSCYKEFRIPTPPTTVEASPAGADQPAVDSSACLLAPGKPTQTAPVASCSPGDVATCTSDCSAHHLESCAALGQMYANGTGLVADFAKARSLFDLACAGGSASACFGLGGLYEFGRGVPFEPTRAVELFTSACDHGHAGACYSLAMHYLSGLGAVQDRTKALGFAREACSWGSPDGCKWLGMLYMQGLAEHMAQGAHPEQAVASQDSACAAVAFRAACKLGDHASCHSAESFERLRNQGR